MNTRTSNKLSKLTKARSWLAQQLASSVRAFRRPSEAIRWHSSTRRPFVFERLETRELMAVTQLGVAAQSHAANDLTLESFLAPAGTDRLLVVVASDTNSLDVTSVKFGSTAMTQVVEKNDGFAVDSIWVLPLGTSASSTTANVTMTHAGAGDFQFIGAVVFQGVYQSNPIGATDAFEANPGSTSPQTRSIGVTSSAGDLVFDVFDVYKTASLPTSAPAVGNNQTVVHSAGSAIGTGFDSYKTSTKPATSPSTSMSWTHNGEETLYLAMNIVAAPTPIVVNSTTHGTDSNPATTTLVEAIQQANTNPGPDIITLPSSTTFLPDDALFIDSTSAGRTMYPSITTDITIQGAGSTLDATGKNARFFHVSGAGNLTLENMNLFGGKAQGGDGAGGNFAGGGGGAGMGGAIFVNGSSASLTVRNSMIANSIAKGGVGATSVSIGGPGGGGGGMGGNGANSGGGGPRSAASGNTGGDGVGGNGGANNGGFGGGGGGGINPSASGIGGFGGGGGGGWTGTGTWGTGGVGGFGGGGGGTTTAFTTPFAVGGAFGGRGAAYNSSGFGAGGSGAGLGGAIFNYQGKVTLENVFLIQNNATGGNGQSLNGVGAGSGAGGAIFNYDGTVSLKHVTAARNTVGTDVAANNPGVATGGSVYNYDAPGGTTPSITISNSILSNSTYTNVTGVEAFNSGSGTIQVIGTNNSSLITSSTGVTGTVLSVDPQLALLESISGRLLIRPFTGSPVIDAADPANTLATDAIGTIRPLGAGPDIGAAEGSLSSTVSLSAGTIVLGDTNADAVFAVDPTSGNRSLISKLNARGTGPDIANTRGIAIDSSNNLYVVNTSPVAAIIKIDPATGNRTTVSSSTVGSGTNFSSPSGIAILADGRLIVSDTGGTNGSAGGDAIFVVDPTTGNRTILSDDVTPNTTNALSTANAILVHSTLGILVSDTAATDTVTRIDGTTGAKTIFSSNTLPNGTNPLSNPQGLAEDTDHSILLVEQGNKQLLRLNAATGARTLVSTFASTDTVEGVAVGSSGIFITKTGPNPDQVFKVNASTGALTVAASNSLGDGVLFGAPNSSGVQTLGFNLGIAVVPGTSNAAPTSLSLTPSSASLAENANTTSATTLSTISIIDDGVGTNVLSLSGTDAASFDIVGNSLRLKAGVVLNFETKSSYSVRVNVDDASIAGTPDAFKDFTLTITDINEAPTSVVLSPSSASLAEDAVTTAATILSTISVTDDALGTNTLSLTGTDAANFEIVSGKLRLKAGVSLNYETKSSYSVRVNVDDSTVGGNPDAFSDFTLTITDINEAPTAVVLTPSSASLAEGADTAAATILSTISVTDDALGTNALSLTGTDASSFEIVSGKLRLKAGVSLNYETKPSYSVRVNVEDSTVGGNPDAFSDFTLTITDINEAPTAVVLTPSSANLAEDADTTAATILSTISITDDALGTNTLSLTGTDASSFEIVSGKLRLKAGVSLNYETKPSYSVRVNVEDSTVGGNPDAFSDFALTITDINEAPIAVVLTPSSATIAEDADTAAATILSTISITDDALGTNTLSLTGADAASFEIVSGTLRLKAGVPLDFETKPSYSVRVNVEDSTVGGNPDAFSDFTLTITDINEAPTAVVLTPSSANLAEDADTSIATTLSTIGIIDDALGTNTLSLSGTDAASFEIVAGTLRLKAGVTLDFETKPSYSVRVNVDDSTIGSSTGAFADFTLTVSDVNEAPTLVTLTPASANVDENLNTTVPILFSNLSIVDDLLGINNASVSGPDAAYFEIVGNQLRLKSGVSLDYETKTTYNIVVDVDDPSVGNTPDVSASFVLNVTNVDDTPPTLSVDPIPAVTINPIGIVTLRFNEDVSGVSLSTLSLQRNGSNVSLAGLTLNSVSPRVFTIDLTSVTSTGGDYTLQTLPGITDLAGNALETGTIASWGNSQVTGFQVQNGLAERSFIQFLNMTFTNSIGLSNLLATGRVRLTRYDLNGLNGVNEPLGTMSVSGNQLVINFGPKGIGGNAFSTTYDGYYILEVDRDGDGTFDVSRRFYRLLGDFNGDKAVNATDVALINAALGSSNLLYDIDGNGIINTVDKLKVQVSASANRKLNAGLGIDA